MDVAVLIKKVLLIILNHNDLILLDFSKFSMS